MPRYSPNDPVVLPVATRIIPVATATSREDAHSRAPFDGYVSAVQYYADGAYTGAATNFRRWQIRNKFSTGTGVTNIAAIDGVGGVNAVAFAAFVITLAAAVPAVPVFSVQPTPTPTTPPVLTNGTGALTAGLYVVAYSYVTSLGGEGPLSPYAAIVQGGANGISVAAVPVPPGVTSVRYYFLVSPGTAGFVTSNTTGAALTLNAQGNGTNHTLFSPMDVTQNDLVTVNSVAVGTGLADPGGLMVVTYTRG
jgi:hypothetical protein